MRHVLISMAAAAFAVAGHAQQNQAPAQTSPTTIRSTSQEVLLDVVVRDKKGRFVKDVTAKDFQVTDDGVPQTIRSFRLVTPSEAGPAPDAGASRSGAASTISASGIDPLRQIRIITLVFDRLGTDGRNNARAAVNDLLKTETGPNLFFAVFSIDQRLSVLQQYTTDKDLIRKATTKVTSSASSIYKSESDQIEEELKTVATQEAANASVATPAAAPPNAGSLVSVALAQLTLNMLQFSQTMDRTLQGRATLFALESLITDQYRLPGRKTLLFFCEGVYIPPEYKDEFDGLVSNANRANVSVYGIDARGLTTFSQNGAAGSLLTQAVNSSRSQQGAHDGPVTRDQATSGDRGEE
ncbi:MAG TPA: VWA domain-containing protein, partial [Bryobacteraceae bacterium]|nr:VWA domain-containing protein [Bryobacteraceae bacterium]